MKTFYKYFFILFVICIVGCSLKRVNNYSKDKPLIINQNIYYDSDFSSNEIDDITEATKEWSIATRGMVKFNIIGELEVANKNANQDFGKNVIIKFNSFDPFIIDMLHNQIHDHGDVIGLEEKTLDGHFVIGIVSDLLKNDTEYKLDVIHELGHAINLVHVDSGPAIMNSMQDKNLRCLTHLDLQQFCDFYSCNVEEMNFCKPYVLTNQMFH